VYRGIRRKESRKRVKTVLGEFRGHRSAKWKMVSANDAGGGGGGGARTATSASSADRDCVDTGNPELCRKHAAACSQPSHKNYMVQRELCKQTCSLCGGGRSGGGGPGGGKGREGKAAQS
jgi:hypothetical protein